MSEFETLHGDTKPQYMLCITVNLVSFAYGGIIGWLTRAPVLRKNDDRGLYVPSTLDVFCIGGIIGTLFFGFLAKIIGRKKTTVSVAESFILTYVLILISREPVIAYAAVFFAGIGAAGLYIILPMYIGETAEDKIRGKLGSYFSVSVPLGLLFSIAVDDFISYDHSTFVWANLSILALFLAATNWLPETPIYSLLNNKPEEALKASIKLRGDANKELIENQFINFASSVGELRLDEKRMLFKDMITDAATRKALIIGCTVLSVQQCSGIPLIMILTNRYFDLSAYGLSHPTVVLIFGALQLIGAIIATVFVERAGRKFLLLVSSAGMLLAHIWWYSCLTGFSYTSNHESNSEFKGGINWLPVISIPVFFISFHLGFGSVPCILLSEIFKTKAKSSGIPICVLLIWIESFFMLKLYADLDAVGILFSCFISSVSCILGFIFTLKYVPETKGKSVVMIFEKLGNEMQGNC